MPNPTHTHQPATLPPVYHTTPVVDPTLQYDDGLRRWVVSHLWGSWRFVRNAEAVVWLAYARVCAVVQAQCQQPRAGHVKCAFMATTANRDGALRTTPYATRSQAPQWAGPNRRVNGNL